MEAMGFFASRVRVREARSSHKCILGVSLASPLSTPASLFWTHRFLVLANFPAGRRCKSSVAAAVSQGPRHRRSPPRCLRLPWPWTLQRCRSSPLPPPSHLTRPPLHCRSCSAATQREPALEEHVLKERGMKRFGAGPDHMQCSQSSCFELCALYASDQADRSLALGAICTTPPPVRYFM